MAKKAKSLPFRSVRARETITAAAAIARLEPRNWASVAQQTLLTSRSNLPDEEAATRLDAGVAGAGLVACGAGTHRQETESARRHHSSPAPISELFKADLGMQAGTGAHSTLRRAGARISRTIGWPWRQGRPTNWAADIGQFLAASSSRNTHKRCMQI